MSFLPAVAGVAAKALPIVGKVASALPVVGNLVKGIGGMFGGGRQQQAPSRGTGYGSRFGEGMSNMHAIGRDAWNTGRDTFMGARDAFRGGDIGGGISGIGGAIDRVGSFGRGMQGGYGTAGMMRRGRRFGMEGY